MAVVWRHIWAWNTFGIVFYGVAIPYFYFATSIPAPPNDKVDLVVGPWSLVAFVALVAAALKFLISLLPEER